MTFLPRRLLPLLFATWSAVALFLYSQTLGTVTGEVRDSTGAVIPGVEITVRNTETNVSRSVTTNDDGSIRYPR
jgi:hypothetical protein